MKREREDLKVVKQLSEPKEVAKALQRGDARAVEAVRQRVRRMITFRGYRIPFDERPDVEQESMAQIWRAANRPGFNAGDGFWGFVDLVAARRCIDWMRTFRASSSLDEDRPSAERSPLAAVLLQEKRQLVLEALSSLDRSCRDLVYLHVAMEKSYKEISSMVGKSEGALRVQMHRCVEKIRRWLAEQPAMGGEGMGERKEKA